MRKKQIFIISTTVLILASTLTYGQIETRTIKIIEAEKEGQMVEIYTDKNAKRFRAYVKGKKMVGDRVEIIDSFFNLNQNSALKNMKDDGFPVIPFVPKSVGVGFSELKKLIDSTAIFGGDDKWGFGFKRGRQEVKKDDQVFFILTITKGNYLSFRGIFVKEADMDDFFKEFVRLNR